MKNNPSLYNFIALMAVLMSFAAFSIDAIMPAFIIMAKDLNAANVNDIQAVISVFFLGMGIGVMFFGPFADSFGRKPAIYIGMAVFLIGCIIAIYTMTLEAMLWARFVQGLGAASFRIITLAIVRDRFAGAQMAKIMSFVTMVFILVPVIAPSIGQVVMIFYNWRAIFILILTLGALSLLWFMLTQEETLSIENRRKFAIRAVAIGVMETVKNKVSIGYTVITGLVFAALIGYLNSAAQILAVQYELGAKFPLVFGSLALMVGASSFINAKLVDTYKMTFLCKVSLFAIAIVNTIFLIFCLFQGQQPALFILLGCLAVTFFCFGILFGNLNALAMQPLGHIAGVANATISLLQTLISVFFGGIIGYSYNGTVMPLVIGICLLAWASLVILFRTIKISAV